MNIYIILYIVLVYIMYSNILIIIIMYNFKSIKFLKRKNLKRTIGRY